MLRYSERINAILRSVPIHNGTIAEIGCDHGKIIVGAVSLGVCDKGIGVDISPQSLYKAENYAIERGVSDRMKFFVGDGFLPIKEKLSCTIIAGLGGIEITKILSQPHESEFYLLSPHQDAHILRTYMRENGLCAIKDFVIQDNNKFYPIIVAKKGKCDYTDSEIYLGKNLPQSKEFCDRNTKRLQYLNGIILNSISPDKISPELIGEWEAIKKWPE